MVSTLQRDGSTPRLLSVGVVTCLVVHATEPDHADAAHATLVDTRASIVWHTAEAVVAAYRRVTDALQAALELQTDLPASRVALSTGETDARGECTAVAAKAHQLLAAANPGATLLSKLAGSLAMDHLPRGGTLTERVESAEPCYELRTA